MAMAFSLIGLRVDGITIENPSCVSKTFPNFFEVLETLQCVDSNVLLSPKGV
jgi:3-phosphoshikimate 1-carboxyvinyltransferase